MKNLFGKEWSSTIAILFFYSIGTISQNYYHADSTFGQSAFLPITCVDLGGVEYVEDTYIKSNGNIVLQSIIYDTVTTENQRIAFTEFTSDGFLNTSFGDDGNLLIPDTITYQGFVFELQNNKKVDLESGIYLFLDDVNPSTIYEMGSLIIKYTSDGILESNFGIDGRAIFQSNDTLARALTGTPLPNGGALSVCVVGNDIEDDSDDDLMMIKYNEYGYPDSNFDSDGYLIIDLPDEDGVPRNILTHNGNELLLCSEDYDDSLNSWKIILKNFNEDGTIDSEWGEIGELSFPIGDDVNHLTEYDLNESTGILYITVRYFDPMPIAGLVTKVDLTTGSLFSEFGIDGFCTILGNTEINQLVTSNLDQLGNLVGAIRGQNGHYLFSFDNNGEISADSIALPLTYVNYEDTSYHWASFISSLDFDESGCIYSALWINGSANTSTSFESRDVCISRFCLNEQSNSVSELVSDELLIYPNPTTGKLFLSNAVSGQSIEIIGDQGQKLKRIEINNSDRFLIDLSDYRDGIYLIRTEKGISRRFIINSN